MSFSSYSQLQDAVAGWLDRTDLTARIPDFVSICEARMRRLIVHEVGLSSTTTFTYDTTGYALPDDFNGIISLSSSDFCAPVIDFVTPVEFSRMAPDGYGPPYRYTIIGGQLFIYPGAAASLTLTYRVKVDLLKYGPNWILENHPDAYLYGTLTAAEPYIVEDERLPLWKSLFEETIGEINADGERQKYSGPLQMTSNGPGY